MYSELSFRQRLLNCLQKNNPFYLISAAFMLGGCLAVTNSLSWTSIPLPRLLILIGTLNIYEAALIALAVYLLKFRNIVRDGVMLLALEAFFLIDITFLNAEIVTSHLRIGIGIDALLFLLTVIKLRVIAALMDHKVLDGRFYAVLLQLAAIFALPIILSWQNDGTLSPLAFYLVWWGVSLLIPASHRSAPAITTSWAGKMLSFYLILPWLSLVLHASILHYVYGVTFYAADAAPLLLGITLAVHWSRPTRFIRRAEMAALRMCLPLAAMFVSLGSPSFMNFSFGTHHTLLVSPSELTFAVAYLVYVYCYFPAQALAFIVTGTTVAAFWFFGPTTDQMSRSFNKLADLLGRIADRIIPQSAQDWGIVAIAAAFAFLGIGASVSLARRQLPPPLPPAETPREMRHEILRIGM